ncbi:hypothetical protein [Clostridium polynesiense]|uniref:hypothetical protein n=1 Tax=Clostridium polynesiense TaxID=1325933 RepID=UPI0005913E2F|nr:hypothetical protein [Clostridium polynesiense]
MKKYLSIILYLLGISNIIFSIGILTNLLSNFNKLYALISIIIVISVIGIKKYKKWAVYLYLLSSIFTLILFVYTRVHYINYFILLINLALIYPVKFYWDDFK